MKSALALVLLAAGCSPEPMPPVLTDVQAPPTVPAGGMIQASVGFRDDDDRVTTVRVAYPSTQETTDNPIAKPLFSGTLVITIRFAPTAPKGPFEYDVSLLDESGLESAIAKEMVTIE